MSHRFSKPKSERRAEFEALLSAVKTDEDDPIVLVCSWPGHVLESVHLELENIGVEDPSELLARITTSSVPIVIDDVNPKTPLYHTLLSSFRNSVIEILVRNGLARSVNGKTIRLHPTPKALDLGKRFPRRK